MLMSAADSCLLIVDMQARLVPHTQRPQKVVDNTRILIQAAERLNVPLLVSEQYPRGLGHTVAELATLVPADRTMERCTSRASAIMLLPSVSVPSAAVKRSSGVEAHVCVLQTVEDLLASGTESFVVADATSSRSERNHAAALDRLSCAGARIVTTEMVVFEWLAKSGTPEFKELSALIK